MLAANAYYAGVRPKVELEAPPMPWNEFNDKVTISGEAGVGPDILYLNYNTYKRLVNSKALREIPEFVYSYSDLEKDFLPKAMEVLKVIDGKYYYVPWELHPPGCIQYNKSLLEREGFAEPPKSWDEFLEMGKAVVKRENDQVVQTAFGMDGPYMFLFTVLYPSLGGVGP
jgi:multiple sugar transport system substrate-binding protein